MFAHLPRLAELKVAVLEWWIGTGPQPHIPGMRFGPQAKSRYVLAVMDRANPQHGLAVGDTTWPKHVATMPHAAAVVLQRMNPAG